MTSDDLRRTYRLLQAPGSERCPTDEELAALVLGELAAGRRAAVADHVVRCRRCTESAGILLETHREASAVPTASTRRRWLSLVAAAAALAAIALLVVGPPRHAPSVERGTPAPAARVQPADGADLAEPPARFAWPGSRGAEAYRLKVFHDTGDLAWQSERLTTPATDIPGDVRARLGAVGAYYWVVEVEKRDGAGRLGPFAFRIATPGR